MTDDDITDLAATSSTGDPSGGFVANELRIRCADAIELVTEFLDDALSQHDLARFEAHLNGCEGCAVFVDQVRMTVTLAGSIGEQQVRLMPANFEALAEQLRSRATPGS